METANAVETVSDETARLYAEYLTHNRNRPLATLRLFLGSKIILKTGKGIKFDLHGAKGRLDFCELAYNAGQDLFELIFYRKGEIVETLAMLYVDQLKDVFERHTGLYLSFT